MYKILVIFIMILLFALSFKINKNIKVCLCTLGKKENLYAKEFVDHYKNLGINKIFIYDNNEKNDERFDLVLKDYINNGLVEIIDFRGKIGPQMKAMEDCRKHNYKIFDWLIFYDMDEFIFLRNFSSIKDFLNQNIFNKCQRIQLNWFFHTDNNLLYYDNRSLIERFPEKKIIYRGKKLGNSTLIKSILKGGIDIKIEGIHVLNPSLIACDGFGNIKKIKGMATDKPDYYYNYIDHYWSKSTEEFVNKLMRGDGILGKKTLSNNMHRIRLYFSYNNITKERINYIENKTKYNLTKYRMMINK